MATHDHEMHCDQCAASIINRVFCHERGCPNDGKVWYAVDGEWVKERQCQVCGYYCRVDYACCDAEEEFNPDDMRY